MKKITLLIYWAPRILALVYVVFLGLFSMEALNGNASAWKLFIGFLVQLIPALIVLLLTVIAWNWPMLGGSLFIAMGIVLVFWMQPGLPTLNYALISGPLFLAGALFLADKTYNTLR